MMMMTTEKEEKIETHTWGTWEELLLACAVKRHGFKNWDSVAMELQSRTSLPHILTSAHNCQLKYQDLHRRFSTPKNDVVHSDDLTPLSANHTNIPWLEELRKLRVAELKQEVHRYDISIHSLQLKVKRLEEEREKSLQHDNQNDDVPVSDLQQDHHTTPNDNKEQQQEEKPEKKDSVSGDESDRENRSVNESNWTGSDEKKPEPLSVHEDGDDEGGSGENEEAEPVLSVSNTKPIDELGDSVTQLSSEVQSSASLGGKKKRNGRKRREDVGVGDDRIKTGSLLIKSEPLISLMENIRAHKHASLYEGPLDYQETDVYKNTIRQHLDLETIQTRLERGSYSSSNLLFFRDLLILFNNAIVYFPKSSNESTAASELRSLVSNEMKKETQKSESTAAPQEIPPQPKTELERSDSLLAKHKASAPIVVCRKRSSLSAKPSTAIKNEQQQQSNDNESPSAIKPPVTEQSSLKIESKDKPVTGARSSRRSNKNLTKGATPASKKQNISPTTKVVAADKAETPPKAEKKKPETLALDKKKGAADFLKRIKKNSPVDAAKKSARGSGNGSGEPKKDNNNNNDNNKNNNTGKGEKAEERVLRRNGDEKQEEESSPSKRNVGRPSKKGVEVSKVSGKRGREGGGGKEAAKRPKKRSRR